MRICSENVAVNFDIAAGRVALLLFLSLALDQVVDFHDQAAECDLLRAQLFLNTSHSFNQALVLIIILCHVIILSIAVELDEFLLEIFFGIGQMFLRSVHRENFAELGTPLALLNLFDNPHHYVLKQVSAESLLMRERSLFLLFDISLDVVDGEAALALQVPVLGDQDAGRE